MDEQKIRQRISELIANAWDGQYRCDVCPWLASVGEKNQCEGCLVDKLFALIAEDRAGLVEALKKAVINVWHESNEITKAIDGRRWITDGRGCYKYDDDTYRTETGLAFNAIEDRITELQKSLRLIDAAIEGRGKQ